MGKILRLSSSIVLLLCLLTLAHTTTHSAGAERKAAGISFDVLNPEAEMIRASHISTISTRVKDLSGRNIGFDLGRQIRRRVFPGCVGRPSQEKLSFGYDFKVHARCRRCREEDIERGGYLCVCRGRFRPGSLGQRSVYNTTGKAGQTRCCRFR